ncbi:hypothetical protein KIN20_033306 [Parelaphostrongylus tenuis]|uniref:Uncharacterized protein n=1 Tax=Parelaphostrongylus tenuis TaxID=148309 RepID=A0AAD5WJ38_PARTN|nr:hypothetical protein KIN20_033306 [Parelaphostrongylus tenuis]
MEVDSSNGNVVSEPIQVALLSDEPSKSQVSGRRRHRLEGSLQRVHRRSQSAGADANLSVTVPSSSNMRVFNLNHTRDPKATSDAKFLRATKRFFKKIYTTATFPNKKVSLDAESFLKTPPLYDNGFRRSVLRNEADFAQIEDFQNYTQTYIDTSYPDSGLDLDRSSTPDQSLGSMTVTSSDSRVTSSESSREDRCEDLFETLRREMHAMRARDAAILADLHRVESQIQSVKLARLGVYGVAAQQQPVQSLPI